MTDHEQQLKEFHDRFLHDVQDHELTIYSNEQVLREDDVGWYRHLRLGKPDSGNMSYEIISVPYYLTMVGDMGSWTFSRLKDNFQLFRADPNYRKSWPEQQVFVNYGYWSEKLQAIDRHGLTEYDSEAVRRNVVEVYKSWLYDYPELEQDLREEVKEKIREELFCDFENEYEARAALHEFESEDINDFCLSDTWEWTFTKYTFHYKWACHAIAWAVIKFDEEMEE